MSPVAAAIRSYNTEYGTAIAIRQVKRPKFATKPS